MNRFIKVWDLPTRLFHWLLVVAFCTAYFTEDDFLTLHVWSGYLIIGLLGFRLLWGFFGNRYARFSDFFCSPARSVAYLKDLIKGKAERFVGHNPAGAAMIALLFVSLIATSVTGLAVYAAEEHAGPLIGIVADKGHLWEEIHEFFANFTVLLVFAHIAGVVVESLVHHENLPKSMVNGYKRDHEQSTD
ncbi:MAG: cytochrome b/b6 domain-containing protein [Gammaproteobacteria bacterium]